ncbi:hypothetical protein [Croceicoccus hydrothermalis]|uniref:hypothetical protein n=1 Tax=Croceicoccus hydrothermalis TaxID=2867964 RepID=UPI001EFBCEF5|nr:hypothetical protein [Croceicoccus hydrothermalis]
MKKLVLFAGVASFALSACGSTDDADAPAEADNVEMPADEVMMEPGMGEDPAVNPAMADDMAGPEPRETPETVETPAAEAVADDAAMAADDLTAAMNEDAQDAQ